MRHTLTVNPMPNTPTSTRPSQSRKTKHTRTQSTQSSPLHFGLQTPSAMDTQQRNRMSPMRQGGHTWRPMASRPPDCRRSNITTCPRPPVMQRTTRQQATKPLTHPPVALMGVGSFLPTLHEVTPQPSLLCMWSALTRFWYGLTLRPVHYLHAKLQEVRR